MRQVQSKKAIPEVRWLRPRLCLGGDVAGVLATEESAWDAGLAAVLPLDWRGEIVARRSKPDSGWPEVLTER